ncbi:MAG: hypothetical protein JNL01_02735 [Bdellovibrionales bacterium]|nr:hypothetical protein [Bdellovibrionales bacterium]
MKRILVLVALTVGVSFSMGCASSRTSGFSETAGKSANVKPESAKAFQVARTHWAKRDQKAEVEKAIAELEKAVQADAGNEEALVLLCRANYLLADGHLDDKDMKKKIWEKGTFWGEKALALNPKIRAKVVDEKVALEEVLDLVEPGQVPALYWTAVNLGKWARLSGIGTTLKYKDRIKKMIEKVEALDPGFFFGAVHRYWGTFYAVAPGFAGGDMNKSAERFKKGIEVAPHYLGTRVLYAEAYALKKGDRALFTEELNAVLKAKTSVVAEIEPENKIEQTKAKKLLASADDLF